MPIYQYTARNEEGRLVRERLAFRDSIALRHHLRRNYLFLLTVQERRRRFGLRRRVRLGDLVIMARQLRTMILAGMPLVSGLEALAEQSTNPRLAEIVGEVARSVGTGRKLGACLP